MTQRPDPADPADDPADPDDLDERPWSHDLDDAEEWPPEVSRIDIYQSPPFAGLGRT
jgi:hypothetical protein